MIASAQHEVKSAEEIIAEDVICQSFIQSSCTLAYACLLIRRRKFDVASHVLHSLEAKQASRFKDMVFYLQAHIGIETGEYAMVKKRLLPRVHKQPNDMVALSLLECCIHREYAGSEAADSAPPPPHSAVADVPPGPFGNAEAASAAVMASAFAATELPAEEPAPAPPPAARGASVPAATAPRVSAPAASAPAASAAPSGPITIPVPVLSAAAVPGRASSPAYRAAFPADTDMGPYQGTANDPNTLALGLWNAKGRTRTFCRAPDLEPLMAMLPREMPGALSAACAALESGPIHKICFSFQHLTATTFHAGVEGMALVTGPLNQSLLAIVRAENTYKKASSGGWASAGGPAGSGPAGASA